MKRSLRGRSSTPKTRGRWVRCRLRVKPTCWWSTVVHRRPSKTSGCGPAFKVGLRVLCARCVEPVNVPLEGSFDLLFRPENADAEAGERAITEDETEIGYYGKAGLLLEDVVREQVLLSLPGRTLCREDCKGLCASCGQNLNTGSCGCAESAGSKDPRWSALHNLASSLKH